MQKNKALIHKTDELGWCWKTIGNERYIASPDFRGGAPCMKICLWRGNIKG